MCSFKTGFCNEEVITMLYESKEILMFFSQTNLYLDEIVLIFVFEDKFLWGWSSSDVALWDNFLWGFWSRPLKINFCEDEVILMVPMALFQGCSTASVSLIIYICWVTSVMFMSDASRNTSLLSASYCFPLHF